jgi:hypothetical protein
LTSQYYQVGIWRDETTNSNRTPRAPACIGDGAIILKQKPAPMTAPYVHGSSGSSVECLKLGYCHRCEWPCKTCDGKGRDFCIRCVSDHIRGNITRAPVEPHSQTNLFSCKRPEPISPPRLVWSNMLKRIQVRFGVKIANKDFGKLLKVWQVFFSRRRTDRT